MKKRFSMALAVSSLLTVSTAFAGHITQPLHHKLKSKTSLSKPTGIYMGIDWLFLEPSDYASKYATVNDEFLNTSDFTSMLHDLNSKRISSGLQGAFHLYTGYAFNHSTSVELGWTHLETRRSGFASVNNSFSQRIFTPGIMSGPFIPTKTITDQNNNSSSALASSANISAVSSYDYDAIDLTLVKTLHATGKLNWQLFAGIRYAEIDHSLDSALSENFSYSHNTLTYISNYDTHFQGIGPRFGVNANYDIYHGIKIFGQVAISFLYSKLDDTNTVNGAINGQLISDNAIKQNYLDRDGIEPNIDAQIGLSYDHPFYGAILGIRAGYQIDYYHDATASLNPNPASGTIVGNPQLQDVSFSGPFIGLVLHG